MLTGTAILYYLLPKFTTEEFRRPNALPKATISDKAKCIGFLKNYGRSPKRQLRAPMSVVVHKNDIYVLDSGNSYLAILTRAGKLINRIDLSLEIGRDHAVGLAVDEQKRIYVSTIGQENKIFVYNSKGDFLYVFPQRASSDTSSYNAPQKPLSVFLAGDKLYVTDAVDQAVKIYTLDGKLLLEFGHPGSDEGGFLYPNSLVVDSHGDIYVSDSNNSRVQVFNKEGEFLYLFLGPKTDSLSLPRGIAMDKKGRLHVVDTLKHKVFVFTKTGRFLYTYGSFGKREQNLSFPNGITINNITSEIYIADKQNNRISIWR